MSPSVITSIVIQVQLEFLTTYINFDTRNVDKFRNNLTSEQSYEIYHNAIYICHMDAKYGFGFHLVNDNYNATIQV